MINLQSQFDFDDAEEGTYRTVAFHDCINVEFFVGFEGIVQFFQCFVLDDLEFDFSEFLEGELLNQVFSADSQVECKQLHHLVDCYVFVIHYVVTKLL